jgi:hypothetical protein
LQRAASIAFFVGVVLNIIGAATSLIGASSLPNLEALRDDYEDYRSAITDAEEIFDDSEVPTTVYHHWLFGDMPTAPSPTVSDSTTGYDCGRCADEGMTRPTLSN